MADASSPQTKTTTLLTRNVFLDTQVFRQLGHNPENVVLKALAGHINDSGLVLHVTDITFSEIRRQLHEFTGKTAQALKTARKEYGRWRHRLPMVVSDDLPSFDAAAVADAAYKALLDAASSDWAATFHSATTVAAPQVFKDYFDGKAPFSNQGSKEFPDAFVIKCLEQWCTKNDERMYVVTADKAMSDAVNDAPHLYHARTLEDLFALIAATETPDIRDTVAKLLKKAKVISSIQTAVNENIGDLIPIYFGDFADGEVTDHELNGDVELVDFKVIAASTDEVSLILDIKAPLTVHIDYDDRSDAVYDKEDDVYFGAETAQMWFDDDPNIRVYARFSLNSAKLIALNMLTNEIFVSEPSDDYS
ncbi:PIN domain-containing protein [Methylobacterium sp. Leaf113]|uniref:PIN domain-containing protein n=1 Tax=Methylobacterium sp. Leaf113 TaxID=1736259 RepID=UPI000B0F54C2|nr:PIN domain-containing protein [Methylobacterium sp. Leaf113]